MARDTDADLEETKQAIRGTMQEIGQKFQEWAAGVRERVRWAVEVEPSLSYQEHLREEYVASFAPDPSEGRWTDAEQEAYASAQAIFQHVEAQESLKPLPRTVAELDPHPVVDETWREIVTEWEAMVPSEDRIPEYETSSVPLAQRIMGLHTRTTEGWDQGRIEEERTSLLPQSSQEQGNGLPPDSWVEAWRERWNVNASRRAAVVRGRDTHTQEQGHGEGYGR